MIGALILSIFIPGADIVVSQDAVDSTRFAAQELADHLKLVTGKESKIVTDRKKGKPTIYVGFSPDVKAAGFTTNGLERQSYKIAFRKDSVYLFGHDEGANRRLSTKSIPATFHFEEHASLYAVYDFLRDWCKVEWFDSTDDGVTVVKNSKLTVSGKDELRKPFVRCRNPGPKHGAVNSELWMRGTPGWTNYLRVAYKKCWERATNPRAAIIAIDNQKRLFNLRMKGGGEFMTANHSFYGWYERFLLKNHSNFEEYHPDWFAKGYSNKKGARGEITAEWDGTKEPPQLCFSNPEVVAQAVKDARDYFDNGGIRKKWRSFPQTGWVWGRNHFCIEPMDNDGFCKCKNCTAQYDMHLKKERREHSRYWFTFVNKVAAELAKTHPDKYISTLAYSSRDGLPPGVELHPNVVVYFCFSFNRMPYSIGGFKRQVSQLKEWHQKYPNRDKGLWLYNTFPKERQRLHGGFYVFPGYFANVLNKEYKLFKELNVSACIFNCGFVDDFENYLSYRWMWNPDEPLEKLKDAYFNRYGSAGKAMRKFYDLVEKRYCDTNNYKKYVHQNEIIAWGRLGHESVMKELESYMNEALNAKGLTEQQRQLVLNFKAGTWDYMTSGNRKVTEIPLNDENVKCRKIAWLGRKYEPFEGNMITNSAFSKPFTKGPRKGSQFHWRDWNGKGISRFRVTLDRCDSLRARCHIRVVGEKDGKIVELSPFAGEYSWTGWRKEIPEAVAYTTVEFTFKKPVGEGCTKIGIEDASPSKNFNWPRFLAIEAGEELKSSK